MKRFPVHSATPCYRSLLIEKDLPFSFRINGNDH